MENRFNSISSKEWLPFQKSWFIFKDLNDIYESNIRFFTKKDSLNQNIGYYGENLKIMSEFATSNNKKVLKIDRTENDEKKYEFILIDLINEIDSVCSLNDYETIKAKIINKAIKLYSQIDEKRFLCILIKNLQINDSYYPYAWDLAKHISTIYSLKDEKIACLNDDYTNNNNNIFSNDNNTFYCLYFKKDANSNGLYTYKNYNFFNNNKQLKSSFEFNSSMKSWNIIKPKPRKKNEILHPAKYPEELTSLFIKTFSKENDNIFDPMSGSGSTQISALQNKRNGFGYELSEYFYNIANQRCEEYINPTQMELFPSITENKYKILNKDSRDMLRSDFPKLNYTITSPPYWDMLNMKGAEYQAKRIKEGLKTNYSDDTKDLGNIENYEEFLYELTQIYKKISENLISKGYITIIVKNIKKKGINYPLAWDLSKNLQEFLILLPEVFWCQDDINIAPYGYGNTWVSNTFHHYCLNFQVP